MLLLMTITAFSDARPDSCREAKCTNCKGGKVDADVYCVWEPGKMAKMTRVGWGVGCMWLGSNKTVNTHQVKCLLNGKFGVGERDWGTSVSRYLYPLVI